MKCITQLSYGTLSLLASLSLASVLHAENSKNKSDSNHSGVTALRYQQKGQQLGDVLGRSVRTTSGNEVGNIKDFVVDRGSGDIRFVLVSSGGLLGVADTVRAVPPSAIQQTSPDYCTVQIDDAKWRNAPTIADNQLTALARNQRGDEIYQYYGKDWKGGGSSNGLAYATEIQGKELRSGGKEVGEIEDLVVNLDKAKSSLILDPEDEFTGTDAKFVLSFDKVSTIGSGDLTTQLTRSDFEKARPFTDDNWVAPAYVGVYTWTVPNTTGASYAGTPARSTMNRDDRNAPIDAVRNAIQSEPSVKNPEKINVLAQNGHVILKGTVQSEDAKDKVENRAEKAANGWPIDNQIQVANSD